MARPIFVFVLSSLALSVAACAGSSGSVSDTSATEPAGNLSGTWKGTWMSSRGASGTSTSVFEQQGSEVDGEFHFTGSPCFAGATFHGTLRGSELTGTARAGGIAVELQATVTSSSLDGTYSALQAGACSGDTGTFTAQR
jgi:hypothetical protein